MKPRHSTPFRSHASIATALSVAFLSCFASPSALAITYYWDNDGATAGFGSAAGTWAAPTTGDATQGWSTDGTGATLPANVTTTTSDTLNFGNTTTGLATGSIAVTGTVSASSVTFAAGSGAITLSGGTIGATSIVAQNTGNIVGSAITLNANGTVSFSRNTAAAGTLTLNGQISGGFGLTFTTPNVSSGGTSQTVVLGAANTYTGNTTITTANLNNATIIRAGVDDALPTSTVLTLNGGNGSGSARAVIFDLNGKNQTLAGLSNVMTVSARNQTVTNTGALATLTVNNSNDYSFGRAATHVFSSTTYTTRARIQGAISMVKSGVGKFTLVESHTYTGTTTISDGKLVGVVGGNHSSSDVTVNNVAAAYGVSITDNTKSWTCKSLATTAAGTLEFNFGAVAPSSSVSPLIVTNAADFSAATPLVSVVVSASLAPGTYPLMTWGSTSGTAPTTANLTVSQLPFGSTAELQVSGNTLNLVITSNLTYTVKANNTDNLNLGSSWVGGTAPGTTALAKWNSTVTSANSTVLGADLTWPGMVIENPTGLVTIGAGNTLTLGAADTDIDMSSATADLTLNCPLALGAANIWGVAATRTLTLGGQVSGAFGFSKLGDGTAILASPANDYTGNTTVTAGTVLLGANNVIPHGAGGVAGNVVVSGTLDLNGKSDSINGLSGSGVVDNTGAAASTLSVGNNAQTSNFSGVIQSTTGNIDLTKTGGGTLTLSGANTFTGATSVIGGTLAPGNASALGNTTGISLSGGTTLSPSLTGINITAAITLGATGTSATITAPNVAGSGTTNFPVTLSGGIGGDGDVNFSGVSPTNAYGVINLNAASTYKGSTLITTISGFGGGVLNNAMIFVNLGVANALPVTTVLTLDGGDGGGSSPGRFCELDLNGNDQTLAGLTNVTGRTLRVQRVVNNSATAATLTVNNTFPYAYSGQLGWVSGYGSTAYNNFGLTKNGSAKFTLSGVCTYTGATTVNGGTLALGANNVLANTTAVSIGGGTLAIGAGFTDTVGTLALTSAATIGLGDSVSTLVFADSSLETWAGPLNITGSFVSGASLRFGDGSGTGLTPAQLASISATGFTGFALNGTGFLTATPSAVGFSAWITGTFANGSVPGDQQGSNDDSDKDGISNLVEYAIAGQDPTVSNASIGSFTAGTLSFTKRAGTSGLIYAIQESTDLGLADDWTEVTGGTYVNDATTISYTLNPGTPVKNFARLKVVSN